MACKTRGSVLLDAHEIVNGERMDMYGMPEDNFATIARLWTEHMRGKVSTPFTAYDVAMMLALMKVARIITGTGGRDSYIDLCGYVALAADMIAVTKGDAKGLDLGY